MTDKEKKTLKYFNNLRATIDESYMLFDEEINVKCGKEMREHISIIFNLIEKHQNRITELEKIEKAHRETNGKLRKELQFKDKMINKLVLVLAVEHCIEQDIVEEKICDNRCVGNDNWTCEKCIKEYFTKKASEDNA